MTHTFLLFCCDMLVNMGINAKPHLGTQLTYYKQKLEQPLIEETQLYYTMESAEFLQKHSVSDYIIRVSHLHIEPLN